MATGASTPGGQGSSHVPVRALVIVLAIQVALGIGLVVWGTQGFPLPGSADPRGGWNGMPDELPTGASREQ